MLYSSREGFRITSTAIHTSYRSLWRFLWRLSCDSLATFLQFFGDVLMILWQYFIGEFLTTLYWTLYWHLPVLRSLGIRVHLERLE